MSQATNELVFLMTDEEASVAVARVDRLSAAWGVRRPDGGVAGPGTSRVECSEGRCQVGVTVLQGDSREVLRTLPDCSVDAVVTDPPYGLGKPPDPRVVLAHWLAGDDVEVTGGGFMGRSWDSFVPGPPVWEECLRVLKPGGHLLAFFGTRTLDMGGLAIRLAGFEIRDSLAWLYGSGFPKSLDVGKAIDRQRYDLVDVLKVTAWVADARSRAGLTNADIDRAFGFNGMAGHWTTQGSQPAVPTLDQVPRLLDVLGVDADGVPDDIRGLLVSLNGQKGQPGAAWFEREVVGPTTRGAQTESTGRYGAWGSGITPTAAATTAAKQWDGWGTALKPAFEPVVVARKPLVGTVAQNVLEHGVGGLNIDGCRVGGLGRWPANVILDDDAAVLLDRETPGKEPSRFFYTAKASKKERRGSKHPTVKPLELMRYLVRLVTPPGGLVLDPFAGSGTTLEAAVLEGFSCIGVEREAEYIEDINTRLGVTIETPAADTYVRSST